MESSYLKIFPSFLATSYDDEFVYRDSFIEYCLSAPNLVHGVKYSNEGGWQSPGFTEKSNPDFFKQTFYPKFKKQLDLTLSQIPFYPRIKLEVSNYWININKPGSYNTQHIHPRCFLSGVFYIKVPEKSGCLVFSHPLETLNPKREYINDDMLDQQILYCGREGQMVIFDSYLPHYVQSNESQEDRISIAFNLKVL